MRKGRKVAIVLAILASFVFGIAFANPAILRDIVQPIHVPQTNRVSIVIYDDCVSHIRTDLKYIETTCYKEAIGKNIVGGTYTYRAFDKTFKFNLPNSLYEKLQGSALLNVPSKLYKYDNDEFELGLIDQVGEKRYGVNLWELP